jgi:hypothetical protein
MNIQEMPAVLRHLAMQLADYLESGPEPETQVEVPMAAQGEVESAQPAPVKKRRLPWGKLAAERYGMPFIEGLLWIESELGLEPEVLLPCMMFESRLDIRARNPHSSASGLIQFMAATAKQLGTSIEAIRSMDAMTQLAYVYKYFKQFHDRGHRLNGWGIDDCYMAILWPAGIGVSLDSAIFTKGTSTYRVNAGLDTNKDGFVSKREAAGKVIRLLEEGLKPENALEI